MPEGDTVYRIAARFRPVLEGRTLRRVESRWPRAVRGLAGATVARLETVGKHMLVVRDDDTLLRVHLGMLGRWWRGAPGERWPRRRRRPRRGGEAGAPPRPR